MEAHAGRRKALVLGLDVAHVERDVRDPVVADGPPGIARRRLGRFVLEELDEGVVGPQHRDLRGRAIESRDLIGRLGPLGPGELENHLEPEQVAIEAERALEVARRDGRMVDSSDHRMGSRRVLSRSAGRRARAAPRRWDRSDDHA